MQLFFVAQSAGIVSWTGNKLRNKFVPQSSSTETAVAAVAVEKSYRCESECSKFKKQKTKNKKPSSVRNTSISVIKSRKITVICYLRFSALGGSAFFPLSESSLAPRIESQLLVFYE